MPSLSVSTCQFLIWIFTTEIPSVTRPISHFMGYFGTQNSLETQFAPALIFGLWRDAKRYPKAQQYIQEMTIPELALQDSDGIISSPLLRIRLKTLTIQQLRQMLHPEKLIEIFKERAPFTWNLLHTFCASPNAWRKWKSADEDEPMLDADEDWPDDPNDDLNLESGDPDPVDSAGHSWKNDYPGFSRNPVFVILLTISMLAFVRNRATNVLPLALGLFFKISGTSSRVVLMLSNAGVCVSSWTVISVSGKKRKRPESQRAGLAGRTDGRTKCRGRTKVRM
ncbi:hypothetical protein K438DRAFT_2006464 [Mycena galopus ATCC 62051]|nr:hypothetical protein K438DRAFT_2006464 [Mycena galopus ATCC 62051]